MALVARINAAWPENATTSAPAKDEASRHDARHAEALDQRIVKKISETLSAGLLIPPIVQVGRT